MALNPQYPQGAGGLYPATSTSKLPAPAGYNAIEPVPAPVPVGVDSSQQLVTPNQSPVSGGSVSSRNPTTLLFGDSMADLATVTNSTQNDYSARSEINHANIALGLPWTFTDASNFGHTGATTETLLSELPAALASGTYSWVLIPGGAHINSINAGVSSDTIISQLKQIFDLLDGKYNVAVSTSLPSSLYAATYAKRTQQARVNRWIMEQCRARGFIGVDTYSRIISPSTGNEISNVLADLVHPATRGAGLLSGAWVAAANAAKVPVLRSLVAYGVGDFKNMVFNPYCAGNNAFGAGGTVAGGLTGNAPDGFEGATHAGGAGVASVVASSDGEQSQWAQVAVTTGATKNAGAGLVFRLTTTNSWTSSQSGIVLGTRRNVANSATKMIKAISITTGICGTVAPDLTSRTPGDTVVDGGVTWGVFDRPVAGDIVQGFVEFQMTGWSGAALPAAYIECLDSGSATLINGGFLQRAPTDDPPDTPMAWGVIPIPPITIPAGTVNVNLRVRTSGAAGTTGNLMIRRADVRVISR